MQGTGFDKVFWHEDSPCSRPADCTLGGRATKTSSRVSGFDQIQNRKLVTVRGVTEHDNVL